MASQESNIFIQIDSEWKQTAKYCHYFSFFETRLGLAWMKPVLRIIKVLFGLRFQFETDVLVHSQSCFPFFFDDNFETYWNSQVTWNYEFSNINSIAFDVQFIVNWNWTKTLDRMHVHNVLANIWYILNDGIVTKEKSFENRLKNNACIKGSITRFRHF